VGGGGSQSRSLAQDGTPPSTSRTRTPRSRIAPTAESINDQSLTPGKGSARSQFAGILAILPPRALTAVACFVNAAASSLSPNRGEPARPCAAIGHATATAIALTVAIPASLPPRTASLTREPTLGQYPLLARRQSGGDLSRDRATGLGGPSAKADGIDEAVYEVTFAAQGDRHARLAEAGRVVLRLVA
jgi:hypothetical protein